MAASVLLKLFINGTERCHTSDAPWRISGTIFSNVNNIHFMISGDKNKNKNSQMHIYTNVLGQNCLKKIYLATF